MRTSLTQHPRSGKAAWLGVGGWALLTLAVSGHIYDEASQNTQLPPQRSAALGDLDELLAVPPDVQAGAWTIPDCPWEMESQLLLDSDVDAALCLSADALSALSDKSDANPGSDLPEHRLVLDLFPEPRCLVRRSGELVVRFLDLDTVRTALCYRQTDTNSFVLKMSVAQRVDADRWQVINLKPRIASSRRTAHLLPILGNCSVSGQRFDELGRLQCEVMQCEGSLEQLNEHWRSHGWELVPATSASDVATQIWRCPKATSAIQVRLLEANTTPIRLVVTALEFL